MCVYVYMCVCVSERERACASVRACMHACVRARVRAPAWRVARAAAAMLFAIPRGLATGSVPGRTLRLRGPARTMRHAGNPIPVAGMLSYLAPSARAAHMALRVALVAAVPARRLL